MATKAPSGYMKHLECPVCMELYKDPRLLPCSHTLCKTCLDGVVKNSSITCPVCRATYSVPQSGTAGFLRILVIAGMVDSLCVECKMTHSDVSCSHCNKMVCQNCHAAHTVFEGVQQSFRDLRQVIHNAGRDVKKEDLQKIRAAVAKEIDNAIDMLTSSLDGRRKKLKDDLDRLIKDAMEIPEAKEWMKELDSKTSEAQRHLDKAKSQLGDSYSDNVTNQEMSTIKAQNEAKIREIESLIRDSPCLAKPMLKYDGHQISSAISSFGSIELLPPDTEDCPVAVDTSGPMTTGRPSVMGTKGLCEFKNPVDVAVCPVTGRVVVTDSGNKRVQVFDASLKHIMNIEKDGNGKQLKWPWGVAVNHAGEIIVSDNVANTVSVYKQNGSHSRHLPGPWYRPCGIAVDTNDDIYVCADYSIKVINKAGEIIRTINCRVTGFSSWPLVITVYKDHLLVSDGGGNIHQLTKSGSYVKKLDVDNVQKARGLAVTVAQDLIIVDEAGPIRILAGDETVSVLGDKTVSVIGDETVSVIGDETVSVIGDETVSVIGDETVSVIRDRGSKPWQLNCPTGVAVTRSGQIIVANYYNHNLLIYDLVKKIYIK